MSTSHEFKDRLRELVERGQVVAVVGAGVSLATNPRAPTWRGLIESAIDRCCTIGEPDDWCQLVRSLLDYHSDSAMLLLAAERVQQKLQENGGGEFADWLRSIFEDLQPEDPAVVHALAALDVPLVTTNYDDLVEKATSLKYVVWSDARRAGRVVRGDDRRVLHVHGHWDEPQSVVLGIRSYEAVKGHTHTQAVLQALAMTNSLLFVGCGDEGLSDPNFGSFLTWLGALETEAGVEHRHYRLVRQADRFPPQGRLYPLEYGEDFSDLAPFLESLRPERADAQPGEDHRPTPVRVLQPLPDAVTHYLNCLTAQTARLTLLGMGRSLQVELPIDEAYVPLKTNLARSLEQRKTERFAEGHAEFEENVDLGDVFRTAADLGERGVILLGEPGAGKTTGARQLAWRLASRQSLPEDLGLPAGVMPVLLRFRNLSRAALKSNNLRKFLKEATHNDAAPDEISSPGKDLWNGRGGPLLWILDGLDEVVDPVARRKVSGWVRQARDKRPDDWFLVTCRFQGYFREGVPLGPRFVEFHVRPLDDQQIEHFVRDWFRAAYGKLLGQGPRAESRAVTDRDELLEILAQPEYQAGHIRELCTNPLLLTILCIVFHEERQLPTRRAELYGHCVQVLLEYWRRDLYQSELGTELKPYDAEAARSVLARVAWWMHQQQDRTVASLDDLAEQAEEGLAQLAASCGLGRDGRAFIQRMRDETGILAMAGDGEGRCGFLHLSFQEYLAAEHAAREGLAQPLATAAPESWWREVALLSLRRSRSFCETFFREMLAAGIAENHPDLAERCLTESLYFAPGPFVDALRAPRPKSAKAHDARVAAILRLLRERAEQVPELEEISRKLAASKDGGTKGLAQEILIRRNIVPEVEDGEPQVLVDRKSRITYVTIPPGEFQMGSDQISPDERPIHLVRITKAFELGKYPVTNAQYEEYMKAAGGSIKKPELWDDRKFNQPEQPVVGVSWAEARAFCEWAGGRLPTEAEWEYACRAGTTTEYSFGNDADDLKECGWFSDNSDGHTQPVCAKQPNAWGLYDVHGNAWEWCADWYGSYTPDDETDPTGPREGVGRVFRGGSWRSPAGYCRSAYRYWDDPEYRYNGLGFRVARSPSGE